MSKKILFMNSTKLAALSVGLLLAMFCTIGMSFTPAEEGENVGDPNDSTSVHAEGQVHHGPYRAKTCESSDSDYTSKLKVTGGNTEKGLVYAANTYSATVKYKTEHTTDEQKTTTSSAPKHTHYAWAKAVRGYDFGGWTASSATYSAEEDYYKVSITAGTSTVTGTLTAKWNEQTSYNVTYNVPLHGAYDVTYTGLKYNETNETIETGEVVSHSLNGGSTAKTVKSYAGDVITLTSKDGILSGWYTNSTGTGEPLSTEEEYTFTYTSSSPTSIYAIYEYTETYYGKLTGSIGTSSVPAGGTICVSNAATGSPTYSDAAQQVTHSSTGSTSLKYYLYAQPNDRRYVLRGWYTDAACTTPASVTKVGDHYEYIFTASSTNSAAPTTGNIYAAFDFNLYYLQVDAKPATLGLGKVLVNDQAYATAPDYTLFTDSASQFGYVLRSPATTKNVYLYAKPKYGYKLSGWYDNPECTGSAKSTANPYIYAATGSSMDPMHPTITTLYAKFVEDATTVNITYNLPDQTKGEYTASVLDIQEIDDEFVWTFTEVYSSVGKSVNTTQAQHKSELLKLEAAPKTGYGVTSWTEGSTTKTTPSRLYQTSGTTAKTLSVSFGDAKPFMVSANNATTGTQYGTLAEALANRGSNTKITVVQDAYVPAGNYIIPNGVTLLVPRDENYEIVTTPVEYNTDDPKTYPALSQYCKLTLSDGANITINGKLCVSGGQWGTTSSNPGAGMPCGAYGSIDMSQGGHITIASGANLYAYGFIFGGGDKASTGTITIQSGGTVYEDIVINDMHGGGGMAACLNGTDSHNDYGLFPFSQYFVQNIEPRMTIEHGGTEKVKYYIFSGFGDKHDEISLIGSDNNCLFKTSAGSAITKWYDYARDYQCYEVSGTMVMSKLEISVGSYSMSSDGYVLPINNNMDITIKRNATLTLPYDIKLLPGAKITIEEGATMDVQKELYVYDVQEWDKYACGYGQVYKNVPGHKLRDVSAANKFSNASIVVNGTLRLSSAAKFYTTSHGSSIVSDGTGHIVFDVAGQSTGKKLYEVWGTYGKSDAGGEIKAEVENPGYAAGQVQVGYYMLNLWVVKKGPYYYFGTPVETTPAKLQNGDGSYVLTKDAALHDEFIYSKNQEKWLKNPKTITWNATGGEAELSSMAYSENAFLGVLPTATYEGYTFAGWYTAPSGGTQIAPTTKVTTSTTYYAHWTPKVFNITYKDKGKAAFSGTHVDSPNAHPTTHTYGTETTLNTATKDYYTFDGWFTKSACTGSAITSIGATATCKDITLYAKWTPISYTITYEGLNGASNSNPTTYTIETATFALANPGTRTGYTFTGWTCGGSPITQITHGSTGNKTITATWTPIKYTITWKNWNDTTLATTEVDYGTTPSFDGTPTKVTDDYSYTFTGWSPTIVAVTGAATYTAQFSDLVVERFYGKRLDIVDWTSEYIIVNATNLRAATGGTGWTINYNSTDYTKANLETNRTVKLARGGASADSEILIKFSGTDGVESRQKYRVPYLVTTNQNLSALSPTPTTSSVVYVKTGSTLTVSADATISKLFISPGANVEISDGISLEVTDTLVLRTLPWQSAAISGDFTAGHTYYTRIGPDKYQTINGLNGTTTYVPSTYYQFAIPFDCNIADVRLSDGTTPAYETTWALKYYSESKRADDGAKANNWIFVTNTGADTKIKAHTGYEFMSNYKFYREYYFPVTPPTTTTDVAVTRTGSDDVNSGWNMICSPLMSRHYRNPVPEDAVVCLLTENDDYEQKIPDHFHPAIPFFYQAAASGNVSFAGEDINPSLAPRRRAAAAEPVRIQWIHLDIADADGQGDQTSIYAHPTRYEERYQTGIDVAKQSLTASRATLYTSHTYGEMAFAGVSDALLEQGVALTVYSPKAQELTISMRENAWLNRMAYVWLFDSETGTYTDLLDSDATIEVNAGTTANRFYIIGRFFAPQITTDLEPTSDSSQKGREVEKLLIHDKLYIRINGVLYDATGKTVNLK